MRSASTSLKTLSRAAVLAMLTLNGHAVQAEAQAIQEAVDTYAQAYDNRDSAGIQASFPEAFYAAISNDPEHTKDDKRAIFKEWLVPFFERFPPADTPALNAHWSRWQNRTVELGETFPTSEGGELIKVKINGTYHLQERQWGAQRTLIAVQENDRWFLMDPAPSDLRRVMRRAYPMITDADAKGTARMFPLEK